MDIIYVNLVKLFWIDNKLTDDIIYNPIMIRGLRKPFKLGEIITVILTKYKQVSYQVYKVASIYDVYELLNDGTIKISHKYNDEFSVTNDCLTFKTYVFTKYVLPKKENHALKMYGFEVIEKEFQLHLNNESKCNTKISTFALYGPNHNGKSSFLKYLEKEYEEKHFLWIDCIKEKAGTLNMEKVLLLVTAYQRSVVLCILNVHVLELCDNIRLSTTLKNYLVNKNYDIKIIITCTHWNILYPELRKLIQIKMPVSGLNKQNRLNILCQMINIETGRTEAEEGLDLFAATLHGYTGRDIKEFIKLSLVKDSTLSLKQLKENKKNKIYYPKQLIDLVGDVESLWWSDIGGYDYVKELLIEQVQEPILHNKRIIKGIILHGPPGCSKTMFARALATECELNMFIMKPSDIMRSLVGESEAKLRKILDVATISAPSIIFIDEIDTLLPKKDTHDDSPVSTRLLNELLTFLDGIGSNKENNVLFMAATNRLDQVDEALRRSGRVDLTIKVDLPDQHSIESILKIAFTDDKFKVDNDVIFNIAKFAKVFSGKSGAEIVHSVKQMKKMCLKDFDEKETYDGGLPMLTMNHVNAIIDTSEDSLSKSLKTLSI